MQSLLQRRVPTIVSTHAETRSAIDPATAKTLDTQALRDNFHVAGLFQAGEIKLVYSQYDHMLIGSVAPIGNKPLLLDNVPETGTPNVLDQREIAILNIGQNGSVTVAGETYELSHSDVLYIGMGAGAIEFAGDARFYIVSAPANKQYPTKLICLEDALFIETGTKENADERVNVLLIHPKVCQSCQLLMGYTQVVEGSLWNNVPSQTHGQRMEAYLYLDFDQPQRVFHLMGPREETRHIVVANEEAIISPPWSIYAASGTPNYTFCWASTGGNCDERIAIPAEELK